MSTIEIYSELPEGIEEGDDSVHATEHEEFLTLASGTRTLMALSAKKRLTPTEKKHVREAIAKYCERSEYYKARWHYLQYRRMQNLGVSATKGGKIDCSESYTCAVFMGGRVAKVVLEDPNGLHWSGYGYTGTLYATNHDAQVDSKFLIGDMGLFGTPSNTRHVITCRKGGTASTAIWTSMGSEPGPYAVRLHYRSDFLGVYRPESLK